LTGQGQATSHIYKSKYEMFADNT